MTTLPLFGKLPDAFSIVTHCQRSSCRPRAQPTQNIATHDPMQGPFSAHGVHVDNM